MSERWWPLLGHRAPWHKGRQRKIPGMLLCQAKVARVPVICQLDLDLRVWKGGRGPRFLARRWKSDREVHSFWGLRGPTDAFRPLRTAVLLGSSLAVGSGPGLAESAAVASCCTSHKVPQFVGHLLGLNTTTIRLGDPRLGGGSFFVSQEVVRGSRGE